MYGYARGGPRAAEEFGTLTRAYFGRDRQEGREARERDGAKPGTVNRDFRTLRAALKKARPDYHFPSGAFFPEDETRVRWLRSSRR